MRSTVTRVLAVVAAAACAAGLSSCRQGRGSAPEISGGDDTAVAGSSTGAPPGGAYSTDSAEARDIEPITFTDEVVGLTETCDQIITDFKAPSYQKGAEASTTVYLLHCTLDYSSDLLFTEAWTAGVLTLSDDTRNGHDGLRIQSITGEKHPVYDDMEAAGLDPINSDDDEMNHVDGWFAFTVAGSVVRADPLPEDAITLVYEREEFLRTSNGNGFIRTGKKSSPRPDNDTRRTYEAYSARSKVTIK